jgi:hypothetical protein
MVEDEVREQDQVELGPRCTHRRRQQWLDGAAPDVPEHRNVIMHAVLRDIICHIIYERAIGVVRKHHLLAQLSPSIRT